MSTWTTTAEQIAEHLRKLVVLQGVEVVVENQRNPERDLEAMLAKQRGAAVLVRWMGGSPVNDSERLVMTSRYMVAIASKEIIRKNEPTIDEIGEAVIGALNQWNPDDSHCDYSITLSGPFERSRTNDQYIVLGIPIERRVVLTRPVYIDP